MVCMRKCCCCCCVRTGTTVLGTVGLILSVILLIPACLSVAKAEWVASKIQGPVDVAGTAEKSLVGSSVIEDTYNGVQMAVLGVSSGVVTWIVLHLFSCLLLIKGASDGRPFLLIPWLVLMMVNILPVTGSFIALVVIGFATNEVLLVPAVLTAIVLGLEIYYWIVVLSLFQELKQEMRLGNAIPPVTVVSLPTLTQGSLPPYERMATSPEIADCAESGNNIV